MAEGHALGDAIGVGWINDGDLAEAAAALGVFGCGQMAAAGAKAQHLAGGGDFEPLGSGFFRFDAFGTSHKFNSIAKERKIYAMPCFEASAIFLFRPARCLKMKDTLRCPAGGVHDPLIRQFACYPVKLSHHDCSHSGLAGYLPDSPDSSTISFPPLQFRSANTKFPCPHNDTLCLKLA